MGHGIHLIIQIRSNTNTLILMKITLIGNIILPPGFMAAAMMCLSGGNGDKLKAVWAALRILEVL